MPRGQNPIAALLGGGAMGPASEIADTVGVSKGSAQGDPITRDLNVGDFDSFGGQVTSGKDVEVGRLKVGAGREMAWGYGTAKNDVNQGYIYVDFQNSTPAAIEGIVSFWYETTTKRTGRFVKSFDTERLDASKTDKTNMTPFPEQVQKDPVGEDEYLVVKLDPASNDTVSSSDSDVIIPATEYDLSGT